MPDLFVFFQAEDGIRDLVRSRGLGDVYKRQEQNWVGRARVLGEDIFECLLVERPFQPINKRPVQRAFLENMDLGWRHHLQAFGTPGRRVGADELGKHCAEVKPVSYTHLTLPTSEIG